MGQVKYLIQAYLLLGCLVVLSFFMIRVSSAFPVKNKIPEISFKPIATQGEITGNGKQLFMANCASCHLLHKTLTGPSLCGFEERGPWADRKNIYQWVRNPAAFMQKNEYAKNLKESYSGVMMTAFPHLSDNDIDEIINYINTSCGY